MSEGIAQPDRPQEPDGGETDLFSKFDDILPLNPKAAFALKFASLDKN